MTGRVGAPAAGGALPVDKPAGPTSHDVVASVRRALGERQIGHTGTLDPLATGVLVLLVGRATRLARYLAGAEKTYDAVVRFGHETTTWDAEGEPTDAAGARPARDAVEAALARFRGTFPQQPPPYSAKKIQGERAYALARRAAPVTPEPVDVTVSVLELTGFDGETAALTVTASAGFYVRALARDLGRAVGVPAHLASLRRTRSGAFGLEAARPLAEVLARPEEVRLRPAADLLPDAPAVGLTPAGFARVRHGAAVRPGGDADWDGRPLAAPVRLLAPDGTLAAVAEAGPGLLRPIVVLV